MTENAIVFVHGLNNGPNERALMQGELVRQLQKWKLLDVLPVHLASVAQWRSLGSWALDLQDMALRPQRRQEAAQDVARVIDMARWRLADSPGKVLVLSHSMGQVHTKEALPLLPTGAVDHVPVIHVSLGGPLGNASPVFKEYLRWALDPPTAHVWHDIWNPDDPVCSDPILRATLGRGYVKPFEQVQAYKLEAPGSPTPLEPLREHSSYFEAPMVADHLRSLLT